MSTDPRLAAELRVMTKAERRVLRQLSIAYAQMTRQIRAWESSSRVGAQVSAAQARVLQTSLRAQMAAMWRAVGNEVRAGRLEAAQLAQQPSKGVLDYFRAAGLTPSEVAQLAESTLAAAEQTVDTALRRMLGESYIPLSDQVWRTQALVDGRLDTVINTTLLKGVNARQLAQAVRGFVRPDARGGTRYAANRLARTEINNAFHAANVSEMQAEPFTTLIQWHLSGSHPKPDECNQYAEKTHVRGQEAGVYEKANVPRRPHPNCLCYTTGLTVERDEFIAAFQRGEYDDWLRSKGVDPGPALRGGGVTGVQAQIMENSAYRQLSYRFWEINGPLDTHPRAEKIYEAWNEYMADGYQSINGSLRTGGGSSRDKQYAKDISLSFRYGAPLDQDTQLFRGVSSLGGQAVKPGSVITDKAFSSVSTLESEAARFSRGSEGWLLRVTAPKGTKVVPLSSGEGELVLNKGTKMRVVSVDDQKRELIVVVQ